MRISDWSSDVCSSDLTFDILILDWNVPGLSGYEVLEWTKNNLDSPPPTLMLTRRSAEEDIVAGLSAGADDYVINPVAPAILVARVNALATRAYPPPTGGLATFPYLSFVTRNGLVEISGEPDRKTTQLNSSHQLTT